jgi:hypothetical protein
MGHIDIYATISMMLVEVENVKLATFKDHKVWMAQVKYESARYWHLNIVLHKLLCGHDSATGKKIPVQNKYVLSVSLVICSNGLGKGDSGSGGLQVGVVFL